MKKYLIIISGALGLLFGACKSSSDYQNLTTDRFEEFVTKPDVQLVDVRSSEEFIQGHLQGAINIDVQSDDFADRASAMLNKKKKVAVYCRSGRRSANAAQQLVKAGFKVTNLEGGIVDWQVAGKKVVK